jgi:hypothetical protein
MTAQDLTVELYIDGAWQDITAADDVFTAPIVIKRGQSDEATQLRPASLAMQLANDDDKYRTSNPVSPLYGKAGRNTPTRVSVGGTVRAAVEASSWAADQTRDFRASPRRGKAWVDFEGGGLLQRIGQWTEPLRSPFYTYNAALTTLAGYWSMEDARGSTKAATPVAGADNDLLLGVSFDSQQRPPGSGPVADVVLQDASSFTFTGGSPNSTAGWQYSVVVNMASLGGGFTTPMLLIMQDGSSVAFSLNDATNETTLLAADANTTTRFETTNAWPTGYQWSGRWIMLYMEATYAAGTTTITAGYRAIDEDTWYFPSGTYAGVPSSLFAASGSGFPDSSSFGHVTGTVGTSEDLSSEDRFTAFRGHAGETAAVRFGRLCDLKGIPYYVSASWADSMPMGPQGVDTFPNLLKEIVSTEDALLYDHRTELRLYFMCRADRYNQTPALDLSPTDLPGLPVEVTDDLDIHNLVTASQRDGGDVTAEDDTGPLGTLPPPDGAGEYRQTVDVNLDVPEYELAQVANWWLRRGTVNLPRFPEVTVNLGALDALKVAEVEAVDVGDVITITGMREYVIRLIVIGYTETIRPADDGNVRRTIVFTCVPDQQFQVGVYDTNRYDLRTSVLNAAKAAGVTSMTFKQTDDESWSTTAVPYDLMISGEQITVTAMGSRSGTGPWLQAATVVRAVNGISKTLPTDAEVHIATPGRWAL